MLEQATETIPPARPLIGEPEIAAAVRVLRSGHVVQGPEVAAFEAEFAALVAGRHCVAVNSGTSALQLALTALGIGPSDEVVVPSFSFAATANAVRLVGAEPVFADIEPATFTLDPAAVAAAIGPRTAAIMPVHLYGHPAAMGPLRDLADRHGLAIVEDACQAHGAALHGRPVGTFGAAGCFSFYPTKNMHSLEGGMIATADPALARTLRLLRNQGMEERYVNEIVGANMRMTDVAAAIGREQLAQLPGWNERRRLNAAYLDAHLTARPAHPARPASPAHSASQARSASDAPPALTPPPVAEGASHVYHQYTVRVHGDRDAAREVLARNGVGSAVYYPTPIHRLPAYTTGRDVPREQRLPETDRASREVLSLPVHPSLTPDELARIAAATDLLRDGP